MKKAKAYETILAIAAGFIALFFIFRAIPLLIIAFAVICIGLVSEFLRLKIHWAWSKLALGLGYLYSRIFLFLIFYIILTPLALLQRLFSKKTKTDPSTNYHTRNHVYMKADLEKPW